jgi:hypothetical protein
MNRLCCLLLICCVGNLFAQTNSPSVSGQLFSTPQVGLRLSNAESDKEALVATDNIRVLHLGSAQSQDPFSGPEPATNVRPEVSFEATSAGGGLSGLSLQIYDRLEKGGYLTRAELPSEDRLDRLVNTIFVPEPIQFRKVSVSCSIINAIKRKNPLCLLNPIFLDVRW